MNNAYENESDMETAVAAGRHRQIVGDLWDELGSLQFNFLVSNGLKPNHTLIDIGCGSLRGGVRFVPYLDPANYYGVDISKALLRAGYEREIVPAGLADRLPASNLRSTSDFDISWPEVLFDYGLAQSLFTHLPLSLTERCLTVTRQRFAPNGLFFATFFTAPAGAAVWQHAIGGKKSYSDRDPFHFTPGQIGDVAEDCGWKMQWVGDWAHPRDQQMCVFRPT